MNRLFILLLITFSQIQLIRAQEFFSDGTPVSEWFYQVEKTDVRKLGTGFILTEYGVVNDSTLVQTEQIQAVIDMAYKSGGGVVIIPEGTYLSGSLFFKPGTHLHLEEGAVLKGSDDISHFAIVRTRMEGQTLDYFAALVNADRVDGFTISGTGTLDGNGLRYWKSFWLRRQINPKCTNMEEMRPRLVYVSNSKDVQLSGIRIMNSPFWTTHFYKCENLKLLDLTITSPHAPVRAPSTDAIDLDVCTNVLVKNCYLSVCDDAIALKGGKGPEANRDENNGVNKNILIEDCHFGFCHAALTCGSESIHSYNIILRRSVMDKAMRMLNLKMRPDTPQQYEYILVEDITGNVQDVISVFPWMQFFDMKGHTEMPLSYSSHITMRNLQLECKEFFHVRESEQYQLSDFLFENLDLQVTNSREINTEYIENFTLKDVVINGLKKY